jgi:sodium/potassium-transporting ATPase subunit alpha
MPSGLSSIQILSIDLGSELAPAISLAYEEEEADLMRRKPRDVREDRLASPQVLCYAYVLAGVIESIGCYISYVLVFQSYGFS